MKKFLAVLGFATALLGAGQAAALPDSPFTKRFQASIGPRFGTDDLNFGLGARAGYVLKGNAYIGAMFDYFFGTTEEVNTAGAQGEVSASMWTFALEGGYDLTVADEMVIRPFGGLGTSKAMIESCFDSGPLEGCVDADDSEFTFLFGALMLYELDPVFVGPELRVMIADGSALVIGGHVGMAF